MRLKSITKHCNPRVTREHSTLFLAYQPVRALSRKAICLAALLHVIGVISSLPALSEEHGAPQLGADALLTSAEDTSPEVGAAMFKGSARLLSAGIIAAGMTFQQVLKAVGPAPEKVEYESSRRNIWHYSDGQVLFREGRVVKIQLPVVGSELPISDPASAPNVPKVPKISKESERVLLEILKEIPSGPDGSSDSSSGIPSPGSPLTPQAMRSNPSMAPFGGISNAESLEDMAE